MRLSENFTYEELTFSSTALVHGINNTPSVEVAERLLALAWNLESIRKTLGQPIRIDSGYRSPALNQIVRGAATSAHVTGYAADFICPAFGSPADIVKAIRAETSIKFDQLIQEGTWVHVSFAPTLRGEVLTARFADGKATYTRGA